MPTLFTLGYGNRTPDAFAALVPMGCLIVDVRDVPRGWSVEYSAKRLRQRFAYDDPDTGVRKTRYVHLKALGNPGRSVDSWPQGDSVEAKAALNRLAGRLAHRQSICLLCGCLRVEHCHRRFIVERLLDRVPGTPVVHL